MSIKKVIKENFRGQFKLADAYRANPDVNPESVRARIYEGLGSDFERIAKGVYKVITNDGQATLLVEGDGRDLSFIEDNSIDCIITDHPWSDAKANKGGNRNFATYDCVSYSQHDFDEKARVLKEGCFLVEFLPTEKESNLDYLYNVKKMAQEAGFQYYCKVPWKKGSFVSNTGRNVKNSEDIMIFTKGKARSMKHDKKKELANPGEEFFMSGAAKMLPATFDYQPPSKAARIHQAEKPVELLKELLLLLTKEGEVVLDQFAGSGVTGEACQELKRFCVLIELNPEDVMKIQKRLTA